MASPRTFSIRIITEGLSSNIQVRDEREVVVLDIPIDPMDNTVPAVISAEALKRLGDAKDQVLKLVSDFLLTHVGAKQFLIVPSDITLPKVVVPEEGIKEFVPAEKSAFERLRHCSAEQLVKTTGALLAQYPDLTNKLNTEFKFMASEASICGEEGDRHYRENCMFLEGHAGFLPSKMAEYKGDAVAGMMARCKNPQITSIRIEEEKTEHLSGFIRAFPMNKNFCYLSDETMRQDIVPLTSFPGVNADEQAKNRNIYLLAYLMHRTSSQLINQQNFIIIAARGREDNYASLGFETFPRRRDDGYTLLVGPPGPPRAELIRAKETLLQNVTTLQAAPKPVAMVDAGTKLFSGTTHLWSQTKEASDARPNNNDSYRYRR